MKLLILLTLFIPLLVLANKLDSDKITYLSLKDCDVPTATRAISELCRINVVATEKSGNKKINILLRDMEAIDALKLVCKSAGLVYRFDSNSEVFTVMTLDEYKTNATVEGTYYTKIFRVEPANVSLIAKTIESLYYQQVVLHEEDGVVDFSSELGGSGGSKGGDSGSGSNNSNNNNNNNNSNQSSNQIQNNNKYQNNISGENALAMENNRTSSFYKLEAGSSKNPNILSEQNGPSIFLTTNVEHNMIIVRTTDVMALDEIVNLIEQMDEPIPQVILEMKILELDIGDSSTVGIDFAINDKINSSLSVSNLASNAASNFIYSYLSNDFEARVEMLANNNNVDIIATPILIAANNRKAEIEVGEERIITVGASSDINIAGENGTINETVNTQTEKRTIGTTLSIIPRINKDRTVTLYVEQESSTLLTGNNSITVSGQTIPIDSVDTAKIKATVVAKDGFTIAMGGLIRSERSESTSKVPVLGDVPILGGMFRSDRDDVKKSELILLIRPLIVDDSEKANLMTQKLMNGLSNHHYHINGNKSIDSQNMQLDRYINGEIMQPMLLEDIINNIGLNWEDGDQNKTE
tara:strand:- start:2455 stop:4200 length:1746 start_codon:yes stop_codon:yes gene_type:complete